MAVSIGINPLTWTNDDMPTLGGETPLEVCLAEAKAAGYDGMELGNKFPRRAPELGPILKRHGLRLVSGWYSGRLLERSVAEEIDAIEDHLALHAALGAEAMVFAEVTGCVHGDIAVPVSHRPKMKGRDWAAFGKKLTDVAKHLKRRGVPMAFHHHMGTVVETEVEVDRLMELTDPEVGLLLDTGHMTYAGGDPIAVAERHGPRINHVHCKDVRMPRLRRAHERNLSFLRAVIDGVFTVPGNGGVDWRGLMPVLRRHDYSGWLVVEAEQDPKKAHPMTYARLGHDFLRPLAAEYGL
jgi:inosose dehydratase